MILAALALSSSALAAPDAARLAELEREVARGGWNARVHAAQALGDYGAAGLPGLRVAAEDADWQVRLTAIHEMGQVGAPAAEDLARLLREEPCRTVRLTALHWLGALGPAGRRALRGALDDESAMVRELGRYWLRKSGEAGPDEPGDAQAVGDEDLRVCAASPEPGRAPWARAAAPARPAAARREDGPVVLDVRTPEPFADRARAAAPLAPPPLPRERLAALDEILGERGARESLPPGPPGLKRPPPSAPEPGIAASVPRAAPRPAADQAIARGAPEVLPPPRTPPAPREVARAAEPRLSSSSPDAPAGVDALPILLRLLRSREALRRGRAADELGAMGAAASSAVADLRRALRDPDAGVRAAAALALGNVGPASDPAVPAIVAALRRGPEEVSWSAALALGRIGTPRARRAFARYARRSAGDLLMRQDRR